MNQCLASDLTIREAINWGASQIVSRDNQIDAKLLMLYVLNINTTTLLLIQEQKISPEQLKQYQHVIALRKEGMPVQYIIGEQEFMGLAFKVNSNVLIPRQDTETLVEKVLEQLDKKEPLKGIDIGTGTGCIGITLAYFLPNLIMTLIDISSKALQIATENVKRHQLEYRIKILESDLLERYKGEQVDFIVSNPPYIAQEEMNSLMTEVKDYEPYLALTDYKDGLTFYKRIADKARDYLKPNGLLAFEIGYNHAKAVEAILKEANYIKVQTYKDLNHNDRVILARKA